MWHAYIGPHVIIKGHPSKLFQNNNNNILNIQILKHVATHRLPLIVTKIVAY
jgi:hypothetical protein